MSDFTAEQIRKIAVQAVQSEFDRRDNEALTIGRNDTPVTPGAPSTTVVDIRKRDGHDMASVATVRAMAREIAKEHRAARRNYAGSFITLARRLSKVPGFGNVKAMQLAQEIAPGSYADYVARQNRGEKLPVLFPREGVEKRLAAVFANGGRLR